MTSKQWKVFLYVASYGNYTKAGEELGYTQPGVTQIIKNLEKEIGFPLFNKSHRGVTLTEEGKRLLPSVRALMTSEESILQEISFLKGAKTGTLKIGAFSSCAIHWVPKIIREFEKEHARIEFEIIEGHENEIGDWVANHKVDVGFYSRQDHDSVEFIPVYNDPLMLVLPTDHPLAEYKEVPIQLLDGIPFVICDYTANSDTYRTLRKYDVHPDIRYTLSNDFSIISMVEHRLAVGILPALALRRQQGDFVVRPFREHITRELGIAVHKSHEMSPALSHFINYAKSYLLDDV